MQSKPSSSAAIKTSDQAILFFLKNELAKLNLGQRNLLLLQWHTLKNGQAIDCDKLKEFFSAQKSGIITAANKYYSDNHIEIKKDGSGILERITSLDYLCKLDPPAFDDEIFNVAEIFQRSNSDQCKSQVTQSPLAKAASQAALTEKEVDAAVGSELQLSGPVVSTLTVMSKEAKNAAWGCLRQQFSSLNPELQRQIFISWLKNKSSPDQQLSLAMDPIIGRVHEVLANTYIYSEKDIQQCEFANRQQVYSVYLPPFGKVIETFAATESLAQFLRSIHDPNDDSSSDDVAIKYCIDVFVIPSFGKIINNAGNLAAILTSIPHHLWNSFLKDNFEIIKTILIDPRSNALGMAIILRALPDDHKEKFLEENLPFFKVVFTYKPTVENICVILQAMQREAVMGAVIHAPWFIDSLRLCIKDSDGLISILLSVGDFDKKMIVALEYEHISKVISTSGKKHALNQIREKLGAETANFIFKFIGRRPEQPQRFTSSDKLMQSEELWSILRGLQVKERIGFLRENLGAIQNIINDLPGILLVLSELGSNNDIKQDDAKLQFLELAGYERIVERIKTEGQGVNAISALLKKFAGCYNKYYVLKYVIGIPSLAQIIKNADDLSALFVLVSSVKCICDSLYNDLKNDKTFNSGQYLALYADPEERKFLQTQLPAKDLKIFFEAVNQVLLRLTANERKRILKLWLQLRYLPKNEQEGEFLKLKLLFISVREILSKTHSEDELKRFHLDNCLDACKFFIYLKPDLDTIIHDFKNSEEIELFLYFLSFESKCYCFKTLVVNSLGDGGIINKAYDLVRTMRGFDSGEMLIVLAQNLEPLKTVLINGDSIAAIGGLLSSSTDDRFGFLTKLLGIPFLKKTLAKGGINDLFCILDILSLKNMERLIFQLGGGFIRKMLDKLGDAEKRKAAVEKIILQLNIESPTYDYTCNVLRNSLYFEKVPVSDTHRDKGYRVRNIQYGKNSLDKSLQLLMTYLAKPSSHNTNTTSGLTIKYWLLSLIQRYGREQQRIKYDYETAASEKSDPLSLLVESYELQRKVAEYVGFLFLPHIAGPNLAGGGGELLKCLVSAIWEPYAGHMQEYKKACDGFYQNKESLPG